MLIEEHNLFGLHWGLPQITVHLEQPLVFIVIPLSTNWFAWLPVKSAFERFCMFAPKNAFASPYRPLLFIVDLLHLLLFMVSLDLFLFIFFQDSLFRSRGQPCFL